MTPEEDSIRIGEEALAAIPKPNPEIIPWAQLNVKLPSSARSEFFNASISPWIIEPIQRLVDRITRTVTLMKPVQSGGSTVGEVVLLYWIMFWRGFIQYNWSKDNRAKERYNSRIKPLFEATACIARLYSLAECQGLDVNFGRTFFRMQGVFVPSNLDSDTIPLQLNEEIHDWEPGHLNKADGRHTAVWNYKQGNISNAGFKNDQLHQKHDSGTMQVWEVLCPGCGKFHFMRERWDKKRPELGGIRYDEGFKTGMFDYDYNRLKPTIRYQFPCGFVVHNEDIMLRRKLSLSGRYSEPRNRGALLSNRSYNYDVACVDSIDWLMLLMERNLALKSRANGNPEPYIKYVQERSCIPYDQNDVPSNNITAITAGLKKNRDGFSDPKLRTFWLDRQQGSASKGELPHWWIVIRDFKIVGDRLISVLVYEGKKEMDQDVIAVLDEHKCLRWQGGADSGDDTTYVYTFCIKYGINAIKGSASHFFTHENGERRIYSSEKPLHVMLNRPPNYEYIEVETDTGTQLVPDPREPMFWLYSKDGIRERLMFMRAYTVHQTPEDVSEDYKSHQESEERIEHVNPLDGSRRWIWNQVKDRNDLFVCECYAAMMADKAGLIVGAEQKKEGNT